MSKRFIVDDRLAEIYFPRRVVDDDDPPFDFDQWEQGNPYEFEYSNPLPLVDRPNENDHLKRFILQHPRSEQVRSSLVAAQVNDRYRPNTSNVYAIPDVPAGEFRDYTTTPEDFKYTFGFRYRIPFARGRTAASWAAPLRSAMKGNLDLLNYNLHEIQPLDYQNLALYPELYYSLLRPQYREPAPQPPPPPPAGPSGPSGAAPIISLQQVPILPIGSRPPAAAAAAPVPEDAEEIAHRAQRASFFRAVNSARKPNLAILQGALEQLIAPGFPPPPAIPLLPPGPPAAPPARAPRLVGLAFL